MSGNVWEWCSDWYDEVYYSRCQKQGQIEDRMGPDTGSLRVIRGGSWNLSAVYCRSAVRNGDDPDLRLHNLGFRLVFVP